MLRPTASASPRSPLQLGNLGYLGLLGFLRVFYHPLWVLHLAFLFFVFHLLGFHPRYRGEYQKSVTFRE
ncbi:MAG: hypothetical protein R6U70_09590 [Bacillota bacterium]